MRVRRWWGWPLVPVYWAAAAVAVRLRRTRRLEWPVVSVGSLSAGGAGKTPVVIALAKLLEGRGWRVDVLSRGYGRAGSGVERVEVGSLDAAERYGDEPVLIAEQAGIPVWVGAKRFDAGMAAEAATGEDGRSPLQAGPNRLNDRRRSVHVLDDGFQHRGLARELDVVLVTLEDLDDAMLPVGNLREGLSALERADVVVVREEERWRVEGRLRLLMGADKAVWRIRRELLFPAEQAGNAVSQVVAFCAIARPEGFAKMLGEAGCEVVETVAFSDHHGYEDHDVARIVAVARERKATGFVTTEKDAVKLSEGMLERLRAVGPVVVVGLEVRFAEEDEVMRVVEAKIS